MKMSDTKVKVAVRVRPMNRRGKLPSLKKNPNSANVTVVFNTCQLVFSTPSFSLLSQIDFLLLLQIESLATKSSSQMTGCLYVASVTLASYL